MKSAITNLFKSIGSAIKTAWNWLNTTICGQATGAIVATTAAVCIRMYVVAKSYLVAMTISAPGQTAVVIMTTASTLPIWAFWVCLTLFTIAAGVATWYICSLICNIFNL